MKFIPIKPFELEPGALYEARSYALSSNIMLGEIIMYLGKEKNSLYVFLWNGEKHIINYVDVNDAALKKL